MPVLEKFIWRNVSGSVYNKRVFLLLCKSMINQLHFEFSNTPISGNCAEINRMQYQGNLMTTDFFKRSVIY